MDNKYLLCRNEQFDKIIKNDGMFDRWINRFSNSYNTKVFVSDNHKYFCQFINGDLSHNNDGDFIKIYVPMNYSHIEEGVNRIFNFIDYNNIKHESKVGSDIRLDSLVIRVTSKEDADAILNFIKNDNYIQEGLLPANPFTFIKDGIPLSCDGMASYNSALSVLLEEFINKNDPNDLTADNFYNYLYGLYDHIVNGRINTQNFINSTFTTSIPDPETFERILVLLINSHNQQFTYNDYLNHFYSGLKTNPYQQQKNCNNILIEEQIYNILSVMIKTYELNDSIRMIYGYIYTGDDRYIPEIGNLKGDILNSNFRSDALNLLHSSDINFVNICLRIMNNYQKNNGDKKRATM